MVRWDTAALCLEDSFQQLRGEDGESAEDLRCFVGCELDPETRPRDDGAGRTIVVVRNEKKLIQLCMHQVAASIRGRAVVVGRAEQLMQGHTSAVWISSSSRLSSSTPVSSRWPRSSSSSTSGGSTLSRSPSHVGFRRTMLAASQASRIKWYSNVASLTSWGARAGDVRVDVKTCSRGLLC